MKKILGYIVATLLLVMPVVTFAASKIDINDFETMDFKETLKSEEMELSYDKYEETDDQAIIYLFRGNGCGYCRAFLTYLNSIAEEYGKYFKVVSFEVWNNSDNSELLTAVSSFLEQPAEGVPFIIIGDQVFPGYAESYNDGIKQAITNLYQTESSKRYDVIEEYNKKLVEDERAERSATAKPIIWNFIFITIATIIIVSTINSAKRDILSEIDSQTTKTERTSKRTRK